jgi:hypothetical protein
VKVQSLGTAVLCAALAACVSPTANEPQVVELRTDRSSYGLGDTGRLTLTNHGPHAVSGGLWPCILEVQQWDGDSWQSAGNFPEVCTGVRLQLIPRLEPGAAEEREVKIVTPPFALLGGEYRIGCRRLTW